MHGSVCVCERVSVSECLVMALFCILRLMFVSVFVFARPINCSILCSIVVYLQVKLLLVSLVSLFPFVGSYTVSCIHTNTHMHAVKISINDCVFPIPPNGRIWLHLYVFCSHLFYQLLDFAYVDIQGLLAIFEHVCVCVAICVQIDIIVISLNITFVFLLVSFRFSSHPSSLFPIVSLDFYPSSYYVTHFYTSDMLSLSKLFSVFHSMPEIRLCFYSSFCFCA